MHLRHSYYKDDYKSKSRSHLTINRRLRFLERITSLPNNWLTYAWFLKIKFDIRWLDLLTNDLIELYSQVIRVCIDLMTRCETKDYPTINLEDNIKFRLHESMPNYFNPVCDINCKANLLLISFERVKEHMSQPLNIERHNTNQVFTWKQTDDNQPSMP